MTAELPELTAELRTMREEYRRGGLDERAADPDPFRQFETWFEEACASEPREPNAMTVATASPDGAPSARVVLLKGIDPRGFVFYTNYESRKGEELTANPRAALLFYWPTLERQVRIEGTVERTTTEESASYFASRPVGSRIGAWASHQSRVIPSREALEARVQALERDFAGRDIPLPPYWGGYRVVPQRFEFWQGRPNRLHDRLRYIRQGDGWLIERLSP